MLLMKTRKPFCVGHSNNPAPGLRARLSSESAQPAFQQFFHVGKDIVGHVVLWFRKLLMALIGAQLRCSFLYRFQTVVYQFR